MEMGNSAREAAVHAALNRLSSAVEEWQSDCAALAKRIEAVCRPEVPALTQQIAAPKSPEVPSSCALADHINDIVYNVERNRQAVRAVIQRLEI